LGLRCRHALHMSAMLFGHSSGTLHPGNLWF
jgi:hypothetical protein